jgi:hypothetical protein
VQAPSLSVLGLALACGQAGCGSARAQDAGPAAAVSQPSNEASESLPMACTRGFWAEEQPGRMCEITVPSRADLCFSSGNDACECACGENWRRVCAFLYSYPPQAVCDATR